MKLRIWLLILGMTLFTLGSPLTAAPQWKTLDDSSDLPEDFCSSWKKGDLMITFGSNLAVIGGVSRPMFSVLNYPIGDGLGCLLSLAPSGQGIRSDICLGSPNLRIRSKQRPLVYSEIKMLPGSRPAVQAIGEYRDPSGMEVRVITIYRFFPSSGRVDIHSTLKNSGTLPLESFRYSLTVQPGTRYTYSPFHEKYHPELNVRLYPRPDHTLAWIDTAPADDRDVLQPGDSEERIYSVQSVQDPQELLAGLYEKAGLKTGQAAISLEDFSGGLVEISIQEMISGAFFFRTFAADQDTFRTTLPSGMYTAFVNFFPSRVEKQFQVAAREAIQIGLTEPPQGTVQVCIQDRKGRYVPGKVTFIGMHPTASPYFEPDNPIETGRGWETFKNSRFPGASGENITLPVGTYLIYASRGPEYSIDQKILEVLKNSQHSLTLNIDRVLDTKGLISLDPHLHTRNSDGAMSTAERIRSVAAEGVDVAVATDHNFVTDYQPELEILGLADTLAVLCGNEITVGGMVHYNTFPVAHRPEEQNHGAIDPITDSMPELFQRSRSSDPETLIQVNHPRSGTIGYFNMYELDPEKAAFAREGFDLGFDVLEIVNGPYHQSANAESIQDWLHLLNRGYYYPLVGSSDSHGIDRSEPGYSRTYLIYEGKKGRHLDTPQLMLALREGRSFSSNGPLVDVRVNRKYTLGDTFTDKDGKVAVRIRVQRAPWVSASEIRLIVNGEIDRSIPLEGKLAEQLDFTIKETVNLTRDSYIVVEIVGHQSLFPVMQRSSSSGLNRNATLPYALTNPVFVDVDGNGSFDAPWENKIELRPSLKDPTPAAQERN